MKYTKIISKISTIAVASLLATQAMAHQVERKTVVVPVVPSSESIELELKCRHGFVVSGGFSDYADIRPLIPTASYPKTTRSWAVELTNKSGRPTGKKEVTADLYVLCGFRHHHHH